MFYTILNAQKYKKKSKQRTINRKNDAIVYKKTSSHHHCELVSFLFRAHDVRDFVDVVVEAEDGPREKKRLTDVDQ